MSSILPAIGSSGFWKLKAPFDNTLNSSVAYSCRAITLLSQAVSDGVEVFEDIYVPLNISQAVYDEHVAAGISLVTLSSTVGEIAIIPSPYIDGWPSNDVVPYVVMAAVVVLGAIPNTLDPTYLTPILQNAVKAALGNTPDVEYVTVSDVTNKLYSDHEAMENARQANIEDDNSDYVRRLIAEEHLVKARGEIAALQKFIIDSGIPIPVVTG